MVDGPPNFGTLGYGHTPATAFPPAVKAATVIEREVGGLATVVLSGLDVVVLTNRDIDDLFSVPV